MKQRVLCGLIPYSVLLLIATQSLAQGLYWESTVTISALGDKGRRSQSYYMPKMLKEVSENHETIIRLDKKVLYAIDATEKTYSETTFDELAKLATGAGAKLNGKLAEMQARLKEMPEEQRKMVEKMMGSHIPDGASTDAKIDVQKSEEKKSIAGLSCSKNKITRNGTAFITIWTTKDLPSGSSSLKKEMKEFSEQLSAMAPRGNGAAMKEGMKAIDGFPMQMESEWMSNTVTKVEQRTTPASAFEIPAGFKKVKLNWMEKERDSTNKGKEDEE